MARNARPMRRRRASSRRAAASARRKPSANESPPTITTSQKWAGWFSQVRSRLGRASRRASPSERERDDRHPPCGLPHRSASSARLYSSLPKSFRCSGGKRPFVDLLPLAHVGNGVDLAVGVHLDRDRDRAAPAVVEEVRERDDVGAAVRVHGAREVTLLRPDLGRRSEARRARKGTIWSRPRSSNWSLRPSCFAMCRARRRAL